MNTDEIVKTDNFHAPVLKNKKGDYRMKPGQTVYLGFSPRIFSSGRRTHGAANAGK